MPTRFLAGLNRLLVAGRLRWRKRFGVLPLRTSIPFLNQWFASPLGRALLQQEQALIDEQLRNLFGYHLLQLSIANQVRLLGSSRIMHRFCLHPQQSPDSCAAAIADFNHLPLPANSIDVVLLHHVLDYSQNPHHALREAAKVLISSGYLVVVGFNPYSLFGVGRWFARLWSGAPQWRHQSLRLGRVIDWLAVLDMEPVFIQQGFYRPPSQSSGAIKYLQWLELWGKKLRLPWGGFYLLVARKDHLAMTPLKPEWQKLVGLRGWGVIRILGRVNRQARDQKNL
ncbi:MAG TPA: class I SAM-dependent methyltransferase [Cellvibrio sp.]|nr:class I SAM-dependent methyltransferase [Cellvibrio sp.]